MLSVSGKEWVETSINNRIIEKANNENNFTSLVSKLVISRNYSQLKLTQLIMKHFYLIHLIKLMILIEDMQY